MLLISILLLGACNNGQARQLPLSGGDDPDRPDGPSIQALRAAPVVLQSERSCGDVLADFQAFAPTAWTAGPVGFRDDMILESAPSAAADGDAATSSDAPTGNTSDTNVQEAGIDEPDIVETDGDFVYLVDGQQLVILDGDTADVLSTTTLAGHGAQLLLSGDRLLAISGGGYGTPMPMPGPIDDIAVDDVVDQAFSSEPPYFSAGTTLQLIDVADRRAPDIIETTEVEGWHVATRVVDGVARVVVASQPSFQPVIEDTNVEDWLPRFRTTDDQSRSIEGPAVRCESVFVPEVNAGVEETSVLRVDFEDGFDPADTTTVVAAASTVYASATTLYVAANQWIPASEQGNWSDDDYATAIHAFDLAGEGSAAHLGGGAIPGHVLNQYSLSEHDGYLRVASTEGTPWDRADPSESGVRILALDDGELVEVGALTGLGVTETIQSVRFMGDVGYVVTFRQTDPLYVVDLSEPTDPRAVGELKIPGFSSYLHPIGEDRLLGIGRDADLEGRDQGFLVSLFDVSDPSDPRQLEIHTERGAWSPAGTDPKAFLWWPAEDAAILPIERGSSDTGIVVLDVHDQGISERGTVTAGGRYPSRALVVQGRLWSLFDGAVAVSDFTDVEAAEVHSYR